MVNDIINYIIPLSMLKKIRDEFPTKAKKREIKKRPRMRLHSRALVLGSKYAGKTLTKR